MWGTRYGNEREILGPVAEPSATEFYSRVGPVPEVVSGTNYNEDDDLLSVGVAAFSLSKTSWTFPRIFSPFAF